MATAKGNKAAPGKAVAKVEEKSNALASFDASILLEDAAQDKGFEREDLAIPFLRILQSGSPMVKRSDPAFVEGAQEGMFINTVTKELWDGEEGVIVVPVAYQRSYTEWVPVDKGGGFVADHGSNDAILRQTSRNDKNKDVLPNGNEITTAGLYYAYVVDPETGAFQQVAISMASTQLKKSRQWNTIIASLQVPDPRTEQPFNPAPFYMAYKLTTVPEQKDQYSWMGFNIETFKPTLELTNGPAIYLAAREFKKMIAGGEVKVKVEEINADTATKGEGDEPF